MACWPRGAWRLLGPSCWEEAAGGQGAAACPGAGGGHSAMRAAPSPTPAPVFFMPPPPQILQGGVARGATKGEGGHLPGSLEFPALEGWGAGTGLNRRHQDFQDSYDP